MAGSYNENDIFRGTIGELEIYLRGVRRRLEKRMESLTDYEKVRKIGEYALLIDDILELLRDSRDLTIRQLVVKTKEDYSWAKKSLSYYTAKEEEAKKVLEERLGPDGRMTFLPFEEGYNTEEQQENRELYEAHLVSKYNLLQMKRYLTVLRCLQGVLHRPKGFFKKVLE